MLRYFMWAVVVCIAFFCLLSITSDPDMPTITYTADAPACPIAQACNF